MDTVITISIKMIDEEYSNIEVAPSRQMDNDEIISILDWVADMLENPPPHLKLVK